jgi:K+-sensing histidine kinase KdpD
MNDDTVRSGHPLTLRDASSLIAAGSIGRYGLTLALVAVATGLGMAADLEDLDKLIVQLFLMAIAIAVWYGGNGPGVVAIVLSGLSVAYFFTAPLYSFAIGPADRHYFAIFLGFAVLIGWFGSRRRRIELELRQARDQLQTEVVARTAGR